MGSTIIALKKGHQSYVTIVSSKSSHGKLYTIAVLDGRSKSAVTTFLESIPLQLKKTVRSVCTDMYDGFVNSAIEVFGVQSVIIDRYRCLSR